MENNEKALLKKIAELEAEIKRLKKNKRFGLVWENKPEKFEKESQNALPVLKDKGGKFKDIVTDKKDDFNILIEGDNYHALSVLSYTHKGKVDVIYIDPPYNTGNTSWRYNNNYIDKDDDFRHSKWVSFMYPRLKLAKNLLSDDGALVCSIDENELNSLGLLLQEIFYDWAIDCVTVVHNPGGIQGTNFSYNHEYAYFVYPKKSGYIRPEIRKGDELTPFRDWGKENSKRLGSPNCFYPIITDGEKVVGFGEIPDDSFHPKYPNEIVDNLIYVWPIDNNGVERRWRFARDTVSSILDELVVKKQGDQVSILRGKRNYTRKTVWDNSKYNANIYGTQLLSQVISGNFPFPKSLYLVQECITAVSQDKKTIVLDFFAGSGTTGHAILELNKQDGGNRKFILCTNNENGICEQITYERIKNVSVGYKNSKGEKIDGLGGNLKYLKTDFIGLDKVNDNLKKKMVDRSTEVLCLKENTFNLVADKYVKIRTKIFENPSKYTAILFDLFYFDDFVEEISKLKDKPTSVYVFSYSKDFSREEFGDLDIDFTVEAIPEKILETYKKIFNF